MSFSVAARIIAAVCAVLAVVWIFFPTLYTPAYGVAADAGAQFMTRRAAPMFVGQVVILWVAASQPRSALRDAVALGVSVIFAGIAMTGIVAFAQGVAAPTILIAALFECLAAIVLWVTRKN